MAIVELAADGRDAHVVDHLGHDDEIVLRLHDLEVVVVKVVAEGRAVGADDDAALGIAALFRIVVAGAAAGRPLGGAQLAAFVGHAWGAAVFRIGDVGGAQLALDVDDGVAGVGVGDVIVADAGQGLAFLGRTLVGIDV